MYQYYFALVIRWYQILITLIRIMSINLFSSWVNHNQVLRAIPGLNLPLFMRWMLSKAAPDRMGFKLSKNLLHHTKPIINKHSGKVTDLIDQRIYIRYKHNAPSAPFGSNLLVETWMLLCVLSPDKQQKKHFLFGFESNKTTSCVPQVRNQSLTPPPMLMTKSLCWELYVGSDTALRVRLSSVAERCPGHAVKDTLAANISYLFLLNLCLQC